MSQENSSCTITEENIEENQLENPPTTTSPTPKQQPVLQEMPPNEPVPLTKPASKYNQYSSIDSLPNSTDAFQKDLNLPSLPNQFPNSYNSNYSKMNSETSITLTSVSQGKKKGEKKKKETKPKIKKEKEKDYLKDLPKETRTKQSMDSSVKKRFQQSLSDVQKSSFDGYTNDGSMGHMQQSYLYENGPVLNHDRSQFPPPPSLSSRDMFYNDNLNTMKNMNKLNNMNNINNNMNEYGEKFQMDDMFRYNDVFQRFEKYFMMYGAYVERWPRQIVAQHGLMRLKQCVIDAIENPQKFAMCPNHVKQRIFAMTAIRKAVYMMRYGRFTLPIELELMYKDGWERSCDICLIKEMEVFGLDCYGDYLKNECVYYVLTNIMKFDDGQKYLFVQQRCNLIIQCLMQYSN